MKVVYMKRKLLIPVIAGVILTPGSMLTVHASEEVKSGNVISNISEITATISEQYEEDIKQSLYYYLVENQEGEYENRAFAKPNENPILIHSEMSEDSDWTGKLYADSTVTVLEYTQDWAKIRSGNAEGYVPIHTLYMGEEAKAHSSEYEKKQMVVTADVLNVRAGNGTDFQVLTQVLEQEKYPMISEPTAGWYPIQVDGLDGWVSGEYISVETVLSYAETKEEEEARLAMEAAQAEQAQAEQAQAAVSISGQNGQAVIDFAVQFIGNPYVWGGTSLTNGADCSGFVQSVYAHFGIQLPRTTWDMESVGIPVSYEEALPGDIVLYDGHVGLYMGDGNIVNAMNEEQGIGICSATYANIITIRRVL
ncbi:MAG: C40 family peptidase [Candidatus Ruminococcus intestinipullorum]|nr:C40 family peptidase [Candidatus Ruminococcus intestinipullorum]